MQELFFRQETQFGTIFVKRRAEKDPMAPPVENQPKTPQEPQ
jgi:hypothetical protein